MIINVLSGVEPNSLDQNWTTRQLIIGLFMFTSLSFLPSLLHLSTIADFPFFQINLSHHSTQNQESHELYFNNHSICTGCFGTSISILLGNTLLTFYFFSDSVFYDLTMIFLLFFLGIILILFTYSRYFVMLSPLIRVFQHSTLFLGLALMIIASDLHYHSTFFMVFLLPSWLAFLITRVQLSKIEHKL
ncbi:MAG: hypothetical protein KAT16_03025 [Candidatus Heimdallarchaeota archaeon]|nr:hypothetical protein [Candidatus Heimdallarchaeota archaeon]